MLKQAFNAVTRLHSQAASIKRLGNPDIYSACRITPSNYFRFLEGPSHTTIHGREFIIPKDSLVGQTSQTLTFSAVPDAGTFVITYGVTPTGSLAATASAADIQTALRLIAGLEAVTVTGSAVSMFVISLIGVQSPDVLTVTPTGLLSGVTAVTIAVAAGAYIPFSPTLKRGDKIIHPTYGFLAMDEIVEIVDIGGEIMGYRARTE